VTRSTGREDLERSRLRDQFRAMRHMKADVELPPPINPDERRLLLDALTQGSGVDLLQWAAVDPQASFLAASITLHDELSALRADIRGLRRARESGQEVPAEIEMLFGGLLNLVDSSEPFVALDQLEKVSAPAPMLRSVLEQLKSSYQLHAGPDPNSAGVQGKRLLLELLKLPDEVDPVEWLRRERSHEVALHALRLVILHMVPPTEDWPGTSGTVLRPRARVRSSRGFHVRVDALAFNSSGFTVTMRIRVPDSRRPERPRGLCFPQWQGFSQVCDDLGNWYVIQPGGGASSKRLWWWESHVQVGAFPGVAETASELTFKAASSPLVWGSSDGDERGLVGGDDVGEVVWKLVLPPKSKTAATLHVDPSNKR
jgi:hypothetical protein